ncbi:MAG: alpha/beta hydrolase [Actinomycetota bacterium]|nr:alpha/beta hydrolase [Actinomycetota bacterium]MDQ3679471.1 alpha/beta hydrolase [Actinomycetota bacterium]
MPTVNVDGTTMHYVDTGAAAGGLSVVLLHAFPLHSGMWWPQIDALTPSFRVIAPDFMGFGSSDAPDEPSSYSMAGWADDVAGLLAALDLDRVVVVGLSMGGYVAFALLERHRPLVSALVLADTRADDDPEQVLERRTDQQRRVRQEGTVAVIDTLLETLLCEHSREHRPEVVVEARRLMDNPPAGFVGALEAMKSRPDSTAQLDAIDVPTLVLVGAHDQPSPPEVAQAMHERIPGSRLAVLPNAGHLSNLEVPDAFNKALLEFLDEMPDPRGRQA